MLSKAENERVTRVGPGTPMGETLRRYWIPSLLSWEIPGPDCPPVRVRLLGEDLVAFRTTDGSVGLLEEFCPHRRASLWLGRNEENGLRCVYHGWKFDVTGQCVDQMNEPEPFASKVRTVSYPTVELGGVIWAYMGPADKMPALPKFDWTQVPKTHRSVTKVMEECNWLQALEGGLDTSHFTIMHRVLTNKTQQGGIGIDTPGVRGGPPMLEVDITDYGYAYFGIRPLGDSQYARGYHFVMPYTQLRPPDTEDPQVHGHCWVPMDDENCMVWNFHYSYGDHPMDDLGPRVADSGNAYGTHVDVENGFRSILNRSNDWGIDRDVQKTESFTGVDGINLQDRAVQESMGRIVDRSREHLGPADKAIIATRKLLLEAVETVENSGDPRGTGPGYHEVRAAERTVPNGADWRQILLPAMFPVSHGSQPQVKEQAGQLMVRDISFDDLKPQPPRDASNTRVPGPANDYGKQALARSREAAKQCRTVRDIPFGPDYYQKLDLYLPEDEAARDVPVLLYFHGGAWQHGYKEWSGFVAPVIVDLPAIFISASYRLVPEVNFPAPLDDAMAALDWVWRNIAAYGGDPNRLFSGGWSVGGTLASLVTLRRELYAPYGLPEDVIKACFAASGGYRYKHDVLAPGNSGKTYGDLMYECPEDELLAEPLHYVKGNHTPFYISWASDDFGHVMQSSQDMVDALKAEGCTVEYDEFNGVDHYDFNLAHGNPEDKWVSTVRRWITTT